MCAVSHRNTISCGKSFSRSHDTVIRVYDEAGNVIGTHDHTSDFKEVMNGFNRQAETFIKRRLNHRPAA